MTMNPHKVRFNSARSALRKYFAKNKVPSYARKRIEVNACYLQHEIERYGFDCAPELFVVPLIEQYENLTAQRSRKR